MKKLYIFKVGKTFNNTKERVGDFTDWIKNFIKTTSLPVEIIDVHNNDRLPNIEKDLGVIITGSHSMVTENLKWSVEIEKWVQEAAKNSIPVFGICYGHQLIGKALGGVVDNNPKGKEIGTVLISVKDEIKSDELFKDTPENFQAHVTHTQSVLSLPSGAKSLGFNNHDKNQIVRFSNLIWGVQFHPEFDEIIMKEYIKEQSKELTQSGFNIDELLSQVNRTNYANTLIEKFVQIVINQK